MARVELEPHDPAWSERFERERDRIRDAAPEDPLGVFHVGSTAVPGLAAKPILDVLAVFSGPDRARATADALADQGFELRRDDPEWFTLVDRTEYPVFVHLRPRAVDAWRDQLAFRELLRADPAARAEYERAKRRAAENHPDDVSAYTDAKEPTIEALVERAYEEGYADRLPALDE